MRTASLALLIVAAVSAPTPAQGEPEYVRIADPRVLVGKYHFEEGGGLTVDISLNADGTALYVLGMGADGGYRAEGFWEVRGGRDKVHIFNRPGPARLDPAGAPTRDSSVALLVVATLPDGSPAEGLGGDMARHRRPVHAGRGSARDAQGGGPGGRRGDRRAVVGR